MPGSKFSNAPGNYSFAVYLMHLRLMVHKEDYIKVGESKARFGLQNN